MASQNEKQDLHLMLETLKELKSEVNNLRAEISRLDSSILKDRIKSVEDALTQNRILLFANQLQDELAEDIGKLTRSECENQPQCAERFRKMVDENLKIIKAFKPKEAVADLDLKIDSLECIIDKAKGRTCEVCHQNFQKRLKREKRSLQMVVLVENVPVDPQDSVALNIDFLVETLLEPLANSARLTILVNLFEGKKSFSNLVEVTNLKGGHLMFHLKKLLAAQLVAQGRNKGDYIVTQRGVGAIKKIMALKAS